MHKDNETVGWSNQYLWGVGALWETMWHVQLTVSTSHSETPLLCIDQTLYCAPNTRWWMALPIIHQISYWFKCHLFFKVMLCLFILGQISSGAVVTTTCF